MHAKQANETKIDSLTGRNRIRRMMVIRRSPPDTQGFPRLFRPFDVFGRPSNAQFCETNPNGKLAIYSFAVFYKNSLFQITTKRTQMIGGKKLKDQPEEGKTLDGGDRRDAVKFNARRSTPGLLVGQLGWFDTAMPRQTRSKPVRVGPVIFCTPLPGESKDGGGKPARRSRGRNHRFSGENPLIPACWIH